MSHRRAQYMGLASDPAVRCGGRGFLYAAELIRHAALSGPSACMFMHRSHTWKHALMPHIGRVLDRCAFR
jgi:hypothetical protein